VISVLAIMAGFGGDEEKSPEVRCCEGAFPAAAAESRCRHQKKERKTECCSLEQRLPRLSQLY